MELMGLSGLSREEMRGFVVSLGESAFRGDQLFGWIQGKRASGFEQMSDLPIAFRESLAQSAKIRSVSIVSTQKSAENTVKYLIGLDDGQAVESVLIPHRYGFSLCLSSQAGCKMGCVFCASAKTGAVRDLSVGEIVGQALLVQQGLDEHQHRISRVDLMGIGEPLDNYDNVMKAIEIMRDERGLSIGIRRFSVSTCGIVPEIKRLAEKALQITLSVSLHAANDRLRSRLMPINKVYPLRELITACDEYALKTGRRVTYEYAMIRSVNDSQEDAAELAGLLRGRLCHVNLIPLNPIAGGGYKRSTPERIAAFLIELERAGIKATTRREMGAGIDAACGQLRRREMNADVRQVRKGTDKTGKPGPVYRRGH